MLCKHHYTITMCIHGCLGWQVTIHDFWCQVAIVALMKRIFQLSAREEYDGWILVPELA